MALRYSSLGGSPLGIIGLFSVPNNKSSNFNGPRRHNFNVNAYNTGKTTSMFSGKRRLRAWPRLNALPSTSGGGGIIELDDLGGSDVQYYDKDGNPSYKDTSTPSKSEKARGSNLLHNDSVYDTSVLNIIEKLAGTRAELKMADFAYLKDLGVYPNNRLMIARRFHSPTRDNIMVSKGKGGPMSVLISWRPPDEDFLEISFGEVWTEAKADFTGMLNSLAEDFAKTGAGGLISGAANAVPLPGFTEIFQRQFLAEVGLLDKGAASSIPAGNPNLIKEAKVRKTVGYGEAGAGLMAKVEIKMTCEYELKFISGIDPTIVWMDLIGNILRFGTSESSNYGLSGRVAGLLSKWANNPSSLLTDVVNAIDKAIKAAYTKMLDILKNIKDAAYKLAKSEGIKATAGEQESNPEKEGKSLADKAFAAGKRILDGLIGITNDIIKGSIMKYRVEVMGIVNALTGNPSTPWHVTIGNPLRPTFCSGDMLVNSVTLRLGPTLAFNDLPSSVTAEFTIQNARALGLQELMSKFNSGYLRTVDVQRSYFEANVLMTDKGTVKDVEPWNVLPGDKDDNKLKYESTSGNGSSGNKTTSGDEGGGNQNANNGSNGSNGNNNTNGNTTSGIIRTTSGLPDTIARSIGGSQQPGSKDQSTGQSKTENGTIPGPLKAQAKTDNALERITNIGKIAP